MSVLGARFDRRDRVERRPTTGVYTRLENTATFPIPLSAESDTRMATTITDDETGKPVVDSDGNQIGVVSAVEHGTAIVDPDPGITDKLLGKLGWDSSDEEDYPLQEARIDTITDDEIRLRSL